MQAAHAALCYAAAHPAEQVHALPFVLVEAADELALCWLAAECEREGVAMSAFCEEDLGGQLTAVAFTNRRLGRKYPLALQEVTSC